MKKYLFLSLSILLLNFNVRSQAMQELKLGTGSNVSYATQQGNMLNCYTMARQMYMVLDIPSFKLGFYLSPDTVITTSDLLVGTVDVPCMNPFTPSCSTANMASEMQKNCSLTNIDLAAKSVPNGTYYIGAYIDYENNVPEDNETDNQWTFRNASGVPAKVFFPGQDLGIKNPDLKHDIIRTYSSERNYCVRSVSGNELLVQLYSLEGKLMYQEKDQSVIIPKQSPGLYLVRISSSKGTLIEKTHLD